MIIPKGPAPDPITPWSVAADRWRNTNADVPTDRILRITIALAIIAVCAVAIAVMVSSST